MSEIKYHLVFLLGFQLFSSERRFKQLAEFFFRVSFSIFSDFVVEVAEHNRVNAIDFEYAHAKFRLELEDFKIERILCFRILIDHKLMSRMVYSWVVY